LRCSPFHWWRCPWIATRQVGRSHDGNVLVRNTSIHHHVDQKMVKGCFPPIHPSTGPTVQLWSIQLNDMISRCIFYDTWLRQQRRPMPLWRYQKCCCTFQYWPWCTVHCVMTISLWTSPLSGAVVTQSDIGFILVLTHRAKYWSWGDGKMNI
jgi:hypothetical protein